MVFMFVYISVKKRSTQSAAQNARIEELSHFLKSCLYQPMKRHSFHSNSLDTGSKDLFYHKHTPRRCLDSCNHVMGATKLAGGV